ncbi:MAG: hypothetical protein FWF45_00620 [Coriobacteriia bacterium]|nr:hypothetical protein [Coriobacteriia bacterium]
MAKQTLIIPRPGYTYNLDLRLQTLVGLVGGRNNDPKFATRPYLCLGAYPGAPRFALMVPLPTYSHMSAQKQAAIDRKIAIVSPRIPAYYYYDRGYRQVGQVRSRFANEVLKISDTLVVDYCYIAGIYKEKGRPVKVTSGGAPWYGRVQALLKAEATTPNCTESVISNLARFQAQPLELRAQRLVAGGFRPENVLPDWYPDDTPALNATLLVPNFRHRLEPGDDLERAIPGLASARLEVIDAARPNYPHNFREVNTQRNTPHFRH